MVVAGAFVVAACGSDSEQLSEEEFLGAANEICEVGNEEVDQLFEDTFAAAGGEEATEEEIPAVLPRRGRGAPRRLREQRAGSGF